ncbi:MAG TPA: hypothetical protein P5229_01890 [Candidatus Gracilibacteria bacterium]|nr:hypothetical protein [Candidatus Gracilibacteria bacterium]
MRQRVAEYLKSILNISGTSSDKILYSWVIKFLFRFGYALGFTTIIAYYVSFLSAHNLPYLYLIQALFVILGMLVFSFMLRFLEVRVQIFISLILGITSVLLAYAFISDLFLFLAFSLIATGVFLVQSNVFISNYIEDFFSPWEAEKAFPVIESAETCGNLLAAITLSLFAGIGITDKIYGLWAGVLLALIVILEVFKPKNNVKNGLIRGSTELTHIMREKQIIPRQQVVSHLKNVLKVPFLQTLMIIMTLSWIIGTLFEFQYTKVVDEAVLAAGSVKEHEAELIGGLSYLQTIFYSFALFTQLLLASRILKKLGTFGGFLLHALVSFFSSLMLFFNFGYFTSVLAKNNFEVSGIIQKNAYEESFYALKHGSQRILREFYECLVSPLSTIFATGTLLIIQLLFGGTGYLYIINALLIPLALLAIWFSFRLQNHYTNMAFERLNSHDTHEAQEHAVEILIQKGHLDGINRLIEVLHSELFEKSIKIKILNELAAAGKVEIIPELLSYLLSDDAEFQKASLNGLLIFKKDLSEQIVKSPFERIEIIKSLKRLLLSEDRGKSSKYCALRALLAIDKDESASFLIELLNSDDQRLKVAALDALRDLKNEKSAQYVTEHFGSSNPLVKVHAIACALQLKSLHDRGLGLLMTMAQSNKKEDITALLEVMPVLNKSELLRYALSKLEDDDAEVKLRSAVALSLIGDRRGIEKLADLLLEGPVPEKVLKIIRYRMSEHAIQILNRLLTEKAVKLRFSRLQTPYYHQFLHFLDMEILNKLKQLYCKLGLRESSSFISSIIETRLNLNLNEIKL